MRTWYCEDQEAIDDAFDAFFEAESPPDRVRASARVGFDPELWARLSSVGGTGTALAEALGGGGATLMDLAVIVRQLGRYLAPVPLIEHAAASRVLAAVAENDPAIGLGRRLADLSSGERIATLALRPLQCGRALLVPAGAVADMVVGFDGSDLLLARSEPPGVAVPNTADLPLADRDLTGAAVVASGSGASQMWRRARAEWQSLMAVACSGLAARALDIGTGYVMQRRQFGVPVGSFQAVQHGLAEAATRSEGARLLAHRAVWAVGTGRPDRYRLAAMALLFCAETARFTTDRVLQYHGGYGYSAEYDIGLYYRRAAGWPLQCGQPATIVAELADLDLGPRSEPWTKAV